VQQSDRAVRTGRIVPALLFACAFAVTGFFFSPAGGAQADGAPVAFAGKQIRLLIGFSPTGYGYDT